MTTKDVVVGRIEFGQKQSTGSGVGARSATITKDSMDSAWVAAETLLPEGWSINLIWKNSVEPETPWGVLAGPFPTYDGAPMRLGKGRTPMAALLDLAKNLAEEKYATP